MARLPFRIRFPTASHEHRTPSILSLPISHPSRLTDTDTDTHTHTHTLSLSLTFPPPSSLVSSPIHTSSRRNGRRSPIASRTGRRPLAHRPRVPAPRASFVHRHPVVVASPISTFPLKLSRCFASVATSVTPPLCLWQRRGFTSYSSLLIYRY